MSKKTTTKVAIVGAGPTGLATAAVLGQAGVDCIVLEKRTEPFTIPRAIAYDPDALRLLQRIGALDSLMPDLCLDTPVQYLGRHGQEIARVAPLTYRFGQSDRGTFYQPEMEAAIAKVVEGLPNVIVRRGVEVCDLLQSSEGVTLRLEGSAEEINADYVVAADGGSSRMRERLGIQFSGWTFEEQWLVVDMENDDNPDRRIRFFCDPERPYLTLPVSKNRRRWEFLIMPGDDVNTIADEEHTRALLSACGVGAHVDIERSVVYTFHSRFAETFRKDRVFLAGDAAHVMPPFAGQGLNSGLRDADNIGWKLALVCNGQAGPALLDSYESERRKSVVEMTKLAVRLGGSIMPTRRWKAVLRDVLMTALWKVPAWRNFFEAGRVVPDPTIDPSPLLPANRKSLAGQMVPQPTLQQDGLDVQLDTFLGRGFAAIGIGCDPKTALHSDDLEKLLSLGAALMSVGAQGDATDTKGVFAEWAGTDPLVLLIRPDRFVADVLSADPAKAELGSFEKLHHLKLHPKQGRQANLKGVA